MKYSYVILLFLLACLPAFGQAEFLVNTATDMVQRDPQIASDSSGNYAVAWMSESCSEKHICLQRFNRNDEKTGQEIRISEPGAAFQEKPALAMNGKGDIVIAWQSLDGEDSMYDIKARLWKAGEAAPGEEILVNTFVKYSQTEPEAAIDNAGNFVIVWTSWNQDGSDRGIYAQRFSSSGNKTGAEFQVNSTTEYSQARPSVKYFADGRFIAAWESWRQDDPGNPGYGVYAQVFNAQGNKIGGEIPVNSYLKDNQWFARIETFSDNRFVICWCSWGEDGSDGGIYFQMFNSDCTKKGPEIRANKTCAEYQWLPKVCALGDGKFAIAWSSWKQDGSREGVYASVFDSLGHQTAFEDRINEYTDGYQWEPDIVCGGAGTILTVWSSYNQFGNDYDIVARRTVPLSPQGYLENSNFHRVSGRTSASFILHVVDNSALRESKYQMTFRPAQKDTVYLTIVNISKQTEVIKDYPIDRGKNVFYRTPVFDGVTVEIIPELSFGLDLEKSFFRNNSGSNLAFSVILPIAGTKNLAPIDIGLIWGRTDTLSDGSYSTPLDTAMSSSGKKEITTPFKAWNMTDNKKVDLLVIEPYASRNKKWDPNEGIIFMTPAPYRRSGTDTHAQLSAVLPAGNIRMPAPGDTNFVLTMRPLKAEDEFTFETSKSGFVPNAVKTSEVPENFILYQNYPNPFNPTTTINYRLPRDGNLVLRIYNILGQKIATLIDGHQRAGQHRTIFKANRDIASGIYFYDLEYENKIICRKMLLLK